MRVRGFPSYPGDSVEGGSENGLVRPISGKDIGVIIEELVFDILRPKLTLLSFD
jgi:hypothetical protein